jgi:BirA family transcriptional regulator, biotin operon repressor / biotin---[acetyl-CoA-carboxylase] ligase
MRIPEPWAELDEVDSTQNVASHMLCAGDPVGVVFAYHQVIGRGRFGREWVSHRGDSLTMSIAFTDYPATGVAGEGTKGIKSPWLLGMAVACAAAGVLGCRVRWPNDLSFEDPIGQDRKVGGILTELFPDARGHLIPVVGIGINIRQTEIPAEIAHRATSLALSRPDQEIPTPLDLALSLIEAIREFPEPTSWAAIEPEWRKYDATPGKRYTLPGGEVAEAIRVGDHGELIASREEEILQIMAAEALFGRS